MRFPLRARPPPTFTDASPFLFFYPARAADVVEVDDEDEMEEHDDSGEDVEGPATVCVRWRACTCDVIAPKRGKGGPCLASSLVYAQ